MAVTAERMRDIGRKSAEVRKTRYGLRRDLRQLGTREAMAVVADVIEDQRPEFAGMRVDELLLWLGKNRAMRCLVAAHVAPYRRVEELTERQRDVICGLLRNGDLWPAS
jgi:hypothetical protein